jgi:dTDP-L-rhamnose 4-epimerase
MLPLNILITGGAGFIGSSLAQALVQRGHNVRVFDNLSPQIHGECASRDPTSVRNKKGFLFIRGDVTSSRDLESSLQGVDTVVHLAAETGTGQSMYEISRYAAVNVGGTANLLDIVANMRLPIRRIILASSRAVYGEGKYICDEHGVSHPPQRSETNLAQGLYEPLCPECSRPLRMLPTDEEAPLRPNSVYGVTKLAQEQLALSVGRATGISTIAFRFQNVFGPGQSLCNPYTGILSVFSTRMRHGLNINIFEDGHESRDFVFISDVVDATIAGIEYPQHITGAFNVGSGRPTSVLTVASKLHSLLGGSSSLSVSGQYRAGDIRHNVADLEKVSKMLHFVPKVTLDDGLGQFVQWVMSEKLQKDRYETSLKEMQQRGLLK